MPIITNPYNPRRAVINRIQASDSTPKKIINPLTKTRTSSISTLVDYLRDLRGIRIIVIEISRPIYPINNPIRPTFRKESFMKPIYKIFILRELLRNSSLEPAEKSQLL